MHNGQIGGFERLRRKVDALIPDELYQARGGTTDSEAIFLMMIGDGLANEPRAACDRMIATVARLQA
ncbi:MAG TPA: hypothetical protein PLQ38_03655, partial [Methanothrix sp.]|nr:hypothetical protein [Methanothrix sp.]